MGNTTAKITVFREVALIAQNLKTLKSIPENDDVLIFIVDELFKHIGVVPEHTGDNITTPIT